MTSVDIVRAVPLDEAAVRFDVPEDVVAALRDIEEANRTIRAGDSAPYTDQWQDSDGVTLYGAWGPIERGIDRLRTTFEWVGTRFTGGELTVTYASIRCDARLAVAVTFEEGMTSVDGREPARMVIRVTHVLERPAGGRWAIVHRHADLAPMDERPPLLQS